MRLRKQKQALAQAKADLQKTQGRLEKFKEGSFVHGKLVERSDEQRTRIEKLKRRT